MNKEPIKEEPEKPKNNKESSEKPEKSELDLDTVLRSDNKLEHVTAERVKAPKRRPPSSNFQKNAVRLLFRIKHG